jgi:hypothetical protein
MTKRLYEDEGFEAECLSPNIPSRLERKEECLSPNIPSRLERKGMTSSLRSKCLISNNQKFYKMKKEELNSRIKKHYDKSELLSDGLFY